MAQDIRDKIAKLLALADSPSEAEARALQEDRVAFQQLLGYNADCAYGSEK